MFAWTGNAFKGSQDWGRLSCPVPEEVARLRCASRDTPVLALARTDTKVLWTLARRAAHSRVVENSR